MFQVHKPWVGTLFLCFQASSHWEVIEVPSLSFLIYKMGIQGKSMCITLRKKGEIHAKVV